MTDKEKEVFVRRMLQEAGRCVELRISNWETKERQFLDEFRKTIHKSIHELNAAIGKAVLHEMKAEARVDRAKVMIVAAIGGVLAIVFSQISVQLWR